MFSLVGFDVRLSGRPPANPRRISKCAVRQLLQTSVTTDVEDVRSLKAAYLAVLGRVVTHCRRRREKESQKGISVDRRLGCEPGRNKRNEYETSKIGRAVLFLRVDLLTNLKDWRENKFSI